MIFENPIAIFRFVFVLRGFLILTKYTLVGCFTIFFVFLQKEFLLLFLLDLFIGFLKGFWLGSFERISSFTFEISF